jgi:uncharacterized delta-60 repeat protein
MIGAALVLEPVCGPFCHETRSRAFRHTINEPNMSLSTVSFALAIVIACPWALRAQTIDPLFNIGTGADGRVTSSVLQLDGKVVIAGNFTTYNSLSAVRVARLLRNGALDPGFNVGLGASSQVNSVALAPDGKVYVGGQFTTFNGTGRNRIARLDTDGSLDLTFDPGTGFAGGAVTQMLVEPDGRIVCVGDFTSYNGTPRSRIARLNTNGTLDTSFDPGTGANVLVTCVARQSNGQLLIGGFFNNYNGNTAFALARVNSDGSFDATYNFGGSGLNNAVSTIAMMPDDKAVLGGIFTTYNGTGRNRILRLNPNGTLDGSFNPGTGAGADVVAMARQSNGQLVIGGTFTTFNGITRNRICRVNDDGSLDATWTAGAGNALNTILWIPEGRVIIGGVFTTYASSPRNRVLRINALCSDEVRLTVTTDGAGSETAWEIVPEGYQYAAWSGSGLPSNAEVLELRCLAEGRYSLRVTDSGSNGITDGGYVLRAQNNERIIDNRGNFTTGALSTISGGQGGPQVFSIPLGAQEAVFTSRDKEDWINGRFVVASPDAAVSQVWSDFGAGTPQRANSGYDFWFFDPNGGYSFVRQRRHSTSDGFGPASATRACHMKINNWASPNHLQDGTLYNVRIRPVVLGVPGAWGPAYRFRIDALRAQCPLTKLMDIPSNPFLSCGQFRDFGPGNYVHARPVSGANLYEFRFRLPAEFITIVRSSPTYFLHLNWVMDPLQAGKTYEVDVRASFDGGATWCTEFIPPALDPWGDICLLTINNAFTGDPPQERALWEEEGTPTDGARLRVWPNPLPFGTALRVALWELPEEATLLETELIDAMGRIVHRRTQAIEGPGWNGLLEVGELPPGPYTLRVAAGTSLLTSRLVVTR